MRDQQPAMSDERGALGYRLICRKPAEAANVPLRARQIQTAPDQSNDAPRPTLLFGKPIESGINALVYTHPRTGLIKSAIGSGVVGADLAVDAPVPQLRRAVIRVWPHMVSIGVQKGPPIGVQKGPLRGAA